jgi:flagellar hook-associated protein 3 FlgL
MMRVSNTTLFNNGVNLSKEHQAAIEKLQQQVSTGLRVLKPSDDPAASRQIINIQNTMASNLQFQQNIDKALSDVEYEESVLNDVNSVIQRAKELAIQASNSALSSTDRGLLVTELNSLRDQLMDFSNTRDSQNNYLFAGHALSTKPVQLISGIYTYSGDEGVRQLNISQNVTVPLNHTAKSVFFDVDSAKIDSSSTLGRYITTTTAPALATSGTLSALNTNELTINQIAIAAATSDGVSSTDASASALAVANAINATRSQHGVTALANANTVNAGTLTTGTLVSGNLSINGTAITGVASSVDALVVLVNNAFTDASVVASNSGGSLVLTAADGRNIQLTTTGSSTVSLSGFSMTGAASDRVKKGSISLIDHTAFTIGGSTPSDVQLSAGTVSKTNNSGSAVVTSVAAVSSTAASNTQYSIIFNSDSSYDIVSDAAPGTALTGYDDVTYTPGSNINFEGIRINITGTPSAGDVIGVQLTQPVYKDLFTTMTNLASAIQSYGGDPARLNYEAGVYLTNLNNAEINILEKRTELGARMNLLESQKSFNQSVNLALTDTKSKLEDVDMAKAISELAQRTSLLEATQATLARVLNLSLFNFLR